MRVYVCVGFILLTSTICHAGEFYTNGNAIGEWDEYDNGQVTVKGKTYKGYYQASHFVKTSDGDKFWVQQLAMRPISDPKKTYIYDQRTGVWIGRFDDDQQAYERLEPQDRRHKLADVQASAFQPADETTLAKMIRRPNDPEPPTTAQKAELPPYPQKIRKITTGPFNLDDALPQSEPDKVIVKYQYLYCYPCRDGLFHR